jgi:trk system potassium uptake protein TrkA
VKKQVVVIGAGRFGSSVARELYQAGNDVLVIDRDESKIQQLLGQATYAVKADATNEAALKELGVPNFEVGVVAIGSDIQASVLITVLLKSLGVPFIIARAVNDLHGMTLERIGANKVVYPEQEVGVTVAHVLLNPGVLDYMSVAPNFGISKVKPPDSIVGRTLEQAGLTSTKEKHGLVVLAIRRGREYILIPAKSEEIKSGDVLVVAGATDSLAKLHEQVKEKKEAAPQVQQAAGPRSTP